MEKYYKILGVESSESLLEIKKKYIKLMRKTHPDKGNDDKQCKLINEAYQKIIEFKLNNEIDFSDNLIPIKFKEMGFDKIPTAMEYVRKRVELSTRLFDDEEVLENKELKKYLRNEDEMVLKDKEVGFFEEVYNYFFN